MAVERARSTSRAPTIREVAVRAGVSKSLVSLVLRGSPSVREAKRQAVLDAMRELDYRPNLLARSLVERRTRAVGVVLSDASNPWWVELSRGMSRELNPTGMTVLFGDGQLSQPVTESLIDLFVHLRVDALCLVGSQALGSVARRAASAVPTVVASMSGATLEHADTVASDDALGLGLAVDHLVSLGHRAIAHLGGSERQASVTKLGGYRAAMGRHGLVDEIRVELCEPTEEAGYHATKRLLASRRPPTAITAVADVACIGAMTAAEELGVAVPGQLSVVGYDNTHLAAIQSVSLTSVDPSSWEMGTVTARLLLDRINRPGRRSRQRLTIPTLVPRGTTGPAPKGPTSDSPERTSVRWRHLVAMDR